MARQTPAQVTACEALAKGDATTKVLSVEQHVDGDTVLFCRHVRYLIVNYWTHPFTEMYRVSRDGTVSKT